MAVCRIIETGVTPEQYDQVTERLGMGDSPPPGAQVHLAARGDDGTVRIVEVWDSRDEAEQFGEKVRAAREEVGSISGEPSITYLDVHRFIQA